MAVTVNVDADKALQVLGIDTEYLKNNGVQVVPYTGGAKFVHLGEVIATWAAAPAKIAELSQKGFKDAEPMHQTIKQNAITAFEQVKDAIGGGKVDEAPQEPTASKTAKGKKTTSSVPVHPLPTLTSAQKVALKDATMLYQPVKSTSADTRYYVIGLSDTIKVAARVKSGSMSVRIEGSAFASVQQNLIAAGVFGADFGGSFSSNYASMHVDISSIWDAQKLAGAVLGVLHDHIKHPVPDLSVISGK